MPLAVEFHIRTGPVAGTQLINDRRAPAVPKSDVSSGNLDDRRFVDQVGAAGSPGAQCEIQQWPGTRWPHGEIPQRDRRAMRVLAAERSAHKRGRGWGSSLGRAGAALSGFCRGCNRRAANASNSASRRRLHPRQVPDRLRCPAEGRTPPHTRPPRTPADSPSTSRGRCPPEAAVDVVKFPLGGGQLILRPPGSGLGGSAVVLRAG